MAPDLLDRAIDLFSCASVDRVRFSGAEPLNALPLVWRFLERFQPDIPIRLTTNGLRLSQTILDRLARDPRVELAISVDGDRGVHLAERKTGRRENDSHDWFEANRRFLFSAFPRPVTVNLVIAPKQAEHFYHSVSYLLGRGVRRLNLLPAYYVSWRRRELSALEHGFRRVAHLFREAWKRGLSIDLANLERSASQALFLDAWVVDVDGEVYENDVVVTRPFRENLSDLSVGNVNEISHIDELRSRDVDWPSLIAARFGARVMSSTRIVDGMLSDFVEMLTTSESLRNQGQIRRNWKER